MEHWYLGKKIGTPSCDLYSILVDEIDDKERERGPTCIGTTTLKRARLASAAPDLYTVAAKIRSHVVANERMGQLDVQTVQELLAALDKAEGV